MKRRKIYLVTAPFRGHLHPLLGIGRRLQQDAEVMVISTPDGVAEAARAGLAGISILAEKEAAVWEIANPSQRVGGNVFRLYRQLKANLALTVQMKTELAEIFKNEQPDLVIADMTVPVAGIAAVELGIPWWSVTPSPCVFETPDGPPAYFGGVSPAKHLGAAVLHAFFRWLTRLFKRSLWWVFRREFLRLGIRSIYRDDGSEAIYSPERIFALGMQEIEFPRSYPAHFQLTGPVLYTPQDSLSAPIFDPSSRAHILITLGTHSAQEKGPIAAVISEMAARHPGLTFHFSYGKTDARRPRRVGNFHEYDYISYHRYLHRYDLVVHHAGSGILYHTLSHGIPAVVCPLDYDQFDNAARLTAAGGGLHVKDHAGLEAAILAAMNDAPLKLRCRELEVSLKQYHAEEIITQQVLRALNVNKIPGEC